MIYETTTSNPESHHDDDDLFRLVGSTALREPTAHTRADVIDGFTVNTNFPEGMLPLEPTPAGKDPVHPFNRSLLPSALDELPPGEFVIVSPSSTHPGSDRRVNITEDEKGKRVNHIYSGLFSNRGNSAGLMKSLGYSFEYGLNGLSVEGVPTPHTLKARAAELGVDVQLFPGQGQIDGEDYLKAFGEGKYPVATGSAEYYAHDTQDDHLVAVVLGADTLKNALSDVANQALQGDKKAMDSRADGIDRFTAYLRGTVSPTLNSMPMPYGENALRVVGERIGLSSEKVTEILEEARKNAAKFSMEVI